MASEGALKLHSGRLMTPQAVTTPVRGPSVGRTKSLMDLLFGTTLAKPPGRPAVIVEWRLLDSKPLWNTKKLVRGSTKALREVRASLRQHNQRRQQQNIAGDSRKRRAKLFSMRVTTSSHEQLSASFFFAQKEACLPKKKENTIIT